MPSGQQCWVCEEIKGFEESIGWIIRSGRYVYLTRNFYVQPAIGSFTEGYLIIAPKKHVSSFSQLSSLELYELETITRAFIDVLQRIYGKSVFIFEHGEASKVVEHAHLNLVPIPRRMAFSTLEILKSDQEEWSKSELHSLANLPYDTYYFASIDGTEGIVAPERYHKRQYLRRILSEALGIRLFDWLTNVGKRNIERTYAKLGYVAVRNILKDKSQKIERRELAHVLPDARR